MRVCNLTDLTEQNETLHLVCFFLAFTSHYKSRARRVYHILACIFLLLNASGVCVSVRPRHNRTDDDLPRCPSIVLLLSDPKEMLSKHRSEGDYSVAIPSTAGQHAGVSSICESLMENSQFDASSSRMFYYRRMLRTSYMTFDDTSMCAHGMA